MIYGIGGQEDQKKEGSEGIANIPGNRTILIQQLTNEEPVDFELNQNCKTIQDVFEQYKPEIEVAFEQEDGTEVDEKIRYQNLGDFSPKGISQQSKYLQKLQAQSEIYQEISKQLGQNKRLQAAVSSPEQKSAMINALQALIDEINEADPSL